MIDLMPDATAALLRHQQQLPEDIRQSCVMLVFEEPINAALLNEFVTIRLTPTMQLRGEENFYMVNRVQPDRLGVKFCPKCRESLHPISLNEFQCVNRQCPVSGTAGVVAGPRTGVLGVRIAPEFVTRTEVSPSSGRSIEYVDRCVIVLDRRYDQDTLAGIFRTANWIAEERGWKLK